MALRGFVLLIYIIAFLIAIISVASIPQEAWQLLSLGQKLVFGFFILVGLCGVLLAYFVWEDGEKLDELSYEIHLKAEKPVQEVPDTEKYRDDIEKRREEAMTSIKESVDAVHYAQAITLVSRYSKRGFLRPELVLDDKVKGKMAKGKTIEQAIEELYNET
jgi:hypothetical protein